MKKRLTGAISVLTVSAVILCSCVHTLRDVSGEVVSVKVCGKSAWKYEITVTGMDESSFTGVFRFYTDSLYRVGDTVYMGPGNNTCPDDTVR